MTEVAHSWTQLQGNEVTGGTSSKENLERAQCILGWLHMSCLHTPSSCLRGQAFRPFLLV